MLAVGIKDDRFDTILCNSFKAKIFNDQLCYEVDLNSLSNKSNIERELELGFNFVMDYNEDRQVTFNLSPNNTKRIGLASTFVQSNHNQHASIYLGTIGESTIYL